MTDADRHYHPLQQPEPSVMQSEVYAPYEVESGYKRHVPDKRIFEEEMYKEYVIPFEYEKTGGSYRYGTEGVSGEPSGRNELYGGCGVEQQKERYGWDPWGYAKDASASIGGAVKSGSEEVTGGAWHPGKFARGAYDTIVDLKNAGKDMEEGMKQVAKWGAVIGAILLAIVIYITFFRKSKAQKELDALRARQAGAE